MSRAAGLDIGRRFAKAAVVEKGARGLKLVGFACVELPARAAGAPQDFSFVLPLLQKAGWRHEPFAATLPCAETAVREVSVPFTEAGQLEKVVRFEAENYLPFPAEDAVLDFLPLERTAEGTRALVFAARKAALGDWLGALKAAGVEPVRVGIEPLALIEALVALDALPEGPCLVLDLGASSTKALFLKDRRLVSVRALRFGADVHASSFDATRYAEKLAREVRRLMASAHPAETPTAALVLGGNAEDAVLGALSKLLGVPAKRVEAAPDSAVGGVWTPETLRDGLTAFGAALPLLRASEFSLDLRRDEFRYRARLEQLSAPLAFFLAAAAVLFAVCAVGIEWRLRSLSGVAGAIAQRQRAIWENLSPGKLPPAHLADWVRQEQEKLQNQADAPDHRGSALEMLRDVMTAIPPNIEISVRSVNISDDRARIEMTAASHSDAAEIVKAINTQTGLVASPRNLRYEEGKSLFDIEATPRKEAGHAE